MANSASPRVGVRAGNLRHSVDLYREDGADGTDTTNEYGQPSGSDDLVKSGLHCRVEPLSGREFELARQTDSRATHAVTLRYSSDWSALDHRHYFLFGTRKLRVSSLVNPEERNIALRVICGEEL